MKLSRIFAAMLVVALSFSMVACDEKGPMEKAREKMGHTADDVKGAAEDVADDVADAADDVADAAEDAVDDVKDAVDPDN